MGARNGTPANRSLTANGRRKVPVTTLAAAARPLNVPHAIPQRADLAHWHAETPGQLAKRDFVAVCGEVEQCEELRHREAGAPRRLLVAVLVDAARPRHDLRWPSSSSSRRVRGRSATSSLPRCARATCCSSRGLQLATRRERWWGRATLSCSPVHLPGDSEATGGGRSTCVRPGRASAISDKKAPQKRRRQQRRCSSPLLRTPDNWARSRSCPTSSTGTIDSGRRLRRRSVSVDRCAGVPGA